MSLANFLNIAIKRSRLERNEITEISDVSREYSFFSGASNLLSVSSGETNKIEKAAIRATSGAFLRKNIFEASFESVPSISNPIAVTEPTVNRTAPGAQKRLSTPQPVKPEPKNPSVTTIAVVKPEAATKIEAAKEKISVNDELAATLAEMQKRKQMVADLQSVKKQPIQKGAPAEIAKKKITKAVKAESEKTAETKKATTVKVKKLGKTSKKESSKTATKKSDKAKSTSRRSASPSGARKSPPQPDAVNIVRAAGNSASTSLNMTTSYSPSNEKHAYSFSDSLVQYLDDLKAINSSKQPVVEISLQEKPTDLFAAFIANEPQISKVQVNALEKPLENLAVSSTKENPGLISENLAKIQAKQGNTKQALEIYQKLQLKYPEKKAYFATQIEKLRN